MSEPDIFTMQGAGGAGAPPPRKRHTARWVVLTVVIVILVILAVVLAYLWRLSSSFDHNVQHVPHSFPQADTRPPAGSKDAQNYLLLGSDKRPAGSNVTGQRSDVIMVAHIAADKHIYVISFPRDSWVPVAGHGYAKVNAALAYGGFPLAVQTIEQISHARIDHVAMITFGGFKAMTNALGGVDVNIQRAFTDDATHKHFTAGVNHVNGDDALVLVRNRHQQVGSDFGRIRNQEAFLKAVVAKSISTGTLTSPSKLSDLVDAASKNLIVDEGFNSGALRSLAFSLRSTRSNDITFFTAPVKGTGTSGDGQSIVLLDDAKLAVLQKDLKSDQVNKYVDQYVNTGSGGQGGTSGQAQQ